MIAVDTQVSNPDSKTCRLGLALSGGAARGFAHIGVIRAFEESNIMIDALSGSSIGSLIALFYASGKTPDEMLEIARTIKKRKLKAIGPFHIGRAGLSYIEHIVKKYVSIARLEDLYKPLFVCATNVHSGRYEIFSSGEVVPAIKASAAVPVKFGEQVINGVTYIDGGMTNNLPVEPLRDQCKIVVGISVNQLAYKAYKMSVRQKIMRLTEFLLNENEKRRIEMCDYHLEIDGLGNIEFEAYDQVTKIHDMGYWAAKKFIRDNPGLINI